MEKIITNDGSITFRNVEYDETCHSVSGALEEAFEKFARTCKLKDGPTIGRKSHSTFACNQLEIL